MAPDEVPRLMMCGDIELPWADVASVAYRLGAYGISWPLAGLSIRKSLSKWHMEYTMI